MNVCFVDAINKRLIKNVRNLVLVGMLVLLTGCAGMVYTPNKQLIRHAIALQIQQTQEQLSEKLNLDFRGFEINHLSISKLQSISIENQPSYRVQGNYDLTLKLPKKKLTQPKKPFDVYLQIQKQGKTWRLLLPESNRKDVTPVWRSYLLK